MFKPKKQINENAVKKDFFSKKNTLKTKSYINIKQNISVHETFFVDKLKEVYLPLKGKQSFVLTKMNSSPFELIENISPDEVLIFFSRISKKQFEFIKHLPILGMAVSSRVLEKNQELHSEIKNTCQIKFSNNHSKMLLFKKEGNFYVIEGSGNPSINARNEFYIIHNSEKMYNTIKKTFQDA